MSRSPPVTSISCGRASASALQAVVDYVVQTIEPELGWLTDSEKERVTVTFTNGIGLQYPRWMLKSRGHDLVPIHQRMFGQAIITPPKLERSFPRVRLVPMELAEIMTKLQES
jgi:hypothetical protein